MFIPNIFRLSFRLVCSSSSPDTGAEKKELCLQLGAEKWVDFRETKDLVKDIREAAGGEGPHAALVSAASVSPLTHATLDAYNWKKTNVQSSAYEQAVDYLRPGGTLLVVGLPGKAQIGAPIFWTVVKGISILGSYVGCAHTPFFIH